MDKKLEARIVRLAKLLSKKSVKNEEETMDLFLDDEVLDGALYSAERIDEAVDNFIENWLDELENNEVDKTVKTIKRVVGSLINLIIRLDSTGNTSRR